MSRGARKTIKRKRKRKLALKQPIRTADLGAGRQVVLVLAQELARVAGR